MHRGATPCAHGCHHPALSPRGGCAPPIRRRPQVPALVALGGYNLYPVVEQLPWVPEDLPGSWVVFLFSGNTGQARAERGEAAVAATPALPGVLSACAEAYAPAGAAPCLSPRLCSLHTCFVRTDQGQEQRPYPLLTRPRPPKTGYVRYPGQRRRVPAPPARLAHARLQLRLLGRRRPHAADARPRGGVRARGGTVWRHPGLGCAGGVHGGEVGNVPAGAVNDWAETGTAPGLARAVRGGRLGAGTMLRPD